jgi:tetratricopeptide (TPR) repeat protein
LAERFDDAFRLLDEADAIYREVGEVYARADNSGRICGRVHLLAGDASAAEHKLLECCAEFERIGDESGLSSVASELGQALYAQGRYADAREWSRVAEKHAPVADITAQFSWRSLRGKLLAREGAAGQAEVCAVAALKLVGGTDLLTHHGEVLLDLAVVKGFRGRDAEASEAVAQALALFESKGDTASPHRARSVLAELIPA